MDARIRWQRLGWPTSTTMLELPICLTVMGAMALVATHSFARVRQHLLVLEAVSLVSGPRTAMMEYHAVVGAWPVSNDQAGYSASSLVATSRLRSVQIREGGSVDVTFSRRAGTNLDGQVLTVRAWQGTASDLPASWRCGRSGAPALAATALDHTTLANNELPSPCRDHP
jgi:Pilin (bacterial filament)